MGDDFSPLEFEFEDAIGISQPPTKKKKVLIGLDDLLDDCEKEKKRLKARNSKVKKIRKACEVEDVFDEAAEEKLSECVEKCQIEISKIGSEEEVSPWGIASFGNQEKLPHQEHPDLRTSCVLQSFLQHEVNSLVELNVDKGEDFLEKVLANGWLLHLVHVVEHVESSIAKWAFNLLLYSPDIRLMEAACDFWCAILTDKSDSCRIKVDWLPRYSDIKGALRVYGFHPDSFLHTSSDGHGVPADSVTKGPPLNINSCIRCINACCKIRGNDSIFSSLEAEELLVVFVSLFLDRQCVGLSLLLHEVFSSLINFFNDDEWPETCHRVVKCLSNRIPCNLNCLRAVESITGVDIRSKQLRSSLARSCLMKYLDEKSCDADDILRSLISINVKDKNCDLFKMYIYLSLTENWLLFDPVVKTEASVKELWGNCLRNCSCGIAVTDLRAYASNVRSKASFLLQSNTNK